jgi:hypothetical protein
VNLGLLRAVVAFGIHNAPLLARCWQQQMGEALVSTDEPVAATRVSQIGKLARSANLPDRQTCQIGKRARSANLPDRQT